MLTRGGAVRWFKVTRAPEDAPASTAPDAAARAPVARRRGLRAARPAGRAALGALQTLAFVAPTAWPLQLLCVAAAGLARARAPRRARAARSAGAFGTAWLGAGTWWLFISMHRYGGLPAPLAALAVLRAGGRAVAVPRRGDGGWSRAGAAAARWRDALLFAAALAAGRAGARRRLHRLSVGRQRLCARRLRRWPASRRGSASTASARSAAGSARLRRAVGAARAARGAGRRSASSLLRRWLGRAAAGRLHRADAARCSVTLLQGNVPQDEKFVAEHAARDARLARRQRCARHAATWWSRPRRRSRCCRRSSIRAGLLAGAARALRAARRAPR